MAPLHLLLFLTLISTIESDIILGIGRKGSNPYASCVHAGSIEAVQKKIPEVKFECEVQPEKYISAIELKFRGIPSYAGGVGIVEGNIGEQKVVVRIWGKKSRSMNYTLKIYANTTRIAQNRSNHMKSFTKVVQGEQY